MCEEYGAVGRCRVCGRYACSYHLRADGVCSVCVETMCRVCGARLSISACPVCAKIICRECSVELQPGIRLCRACYSRLLSDPSYSRFRAYLSRFSRELGGKAI